MEYTKWYTLPNGGLRPRWSVRIMNNIFRLGITHSRNNYFSLYFGTIHATFYKRTDYQPVYRRPLENRRYAVGLYTFLWQVGVNKFKRRWRFDLFYGGRDRQYIKHLN